MFKRQEDDVPNRYIRERIRQVRIAANESQDDLAKKLSKSRVTVSDMERGRVAVSAADLAFIAALYEKPISFFYPPRVTVNKDELSKLEEEIIFLFSQLPDTQQRIALEYIKQQVEITIKASDQEFEERYAEFKSNRKKPSIFSVTSVDLNPEELKPNNKVGKSKK
jgi:transcriptional regulator with XRE-family HTH domain